MTHYDHDYEDDIESTGAEVTGAREESESDRAQARRDNAACDGPGSSRPFNDWGRFT
jgi:hypothetical protein